MRFAVVGATGNVGVPVSRALLAAGHSVRVLSRGGRGEAALVERGAESVRGSFESGTGDLQTFFRDVDAAFALVRSDWNDVDHYPVVARRLSYALRLHRPPRVVYLSSVGADLDDAGHSSDFGIVERTLSRAVGGALTSVRAGWFMDNYLAHVDEVARSGVLSTAIADDIPLPLVSTADVARAVVEELTSPAPAPAVREVQGPADVTMAEATLRISGAIGRPVSLRRIERPASSPSGAMFDARAQSALERYRRESDAAFNERRARFRGPRNDFDRTSLTFDTYVHDVWLRAYRRVADR